MTKPTLKLIKKRPGARYKKTVIIKKNGERKVLVKVKKIQKTSPVSLSQDQAAEDAPTLLGETNMITDTYYLSSETNTTADTNRSVTDMSPPDANTTMEEESDANTTLPPLLPEQSHQPPEHTISPDNEPSSPKTTDLQTTDEHPTTPFPASNWKRHYFTLALGSTSRVRTTKVDTVNRGTYVTLKNTGHTLPADGSVYEYDDTETPLHIEGGYLYKPAIIGSSLYLSGYYDDDLMEFRGAYKYTLDDYALFFPGIKIGAALTHDNADDSDYDATAYFAGIALDRRLINGMIVGVEYLYLRRQWIQKEEFFGTVTCEDRESALRLTLDIPLF